MAKKKGFFQRIYHKDKTGKKIALFALKLTSVTFALFLTTVTLAVALISKDEDRGYYYDNSFFLGNGEVRATSSRLAVSGQAVTDDEKTAYGVYGRSFSKAYAGFNEKVIVGDAVGIYGDAIADNGYPISGGNVYGLWGNAEIRSENGGNATGVYGKISDHKGSADNAFGVRGEVYDREDSARGDHFGVYGLYTGEGKGFGVYGETVGGGIGSAAIYGKGEDDGYAGLFKGTVKVEGDTVLGVSGKEKGTVCSAEGAIYYNSEISEICFCNGANWMKAAATSTLCK